MTARKPGRFFIALGSVIIVVSVTYLTYALQQLRAALYRIEVMRPGVSTYHAVRPPEPRAGVFGPDDEILQNLYDQLFVTEQTKPDLLRSLAETAGRPIVVRVEMDPANPDVGGGVSADRLPLRIELTGSFPEVVGYLSRLDLSPRLIIVEQVDVESVEVSGEKLVKAEVAGSVYWK